MYYYCNNRINITDFEIFKRYDRANSRTSLWKVPLLWSVTWLSHGQCWATVKGTASLTRRKSLSFYCTFDRRSPGASQRVCIPKPTWALSVVCLSLWQGSIQLTGCHPRYWFLLFSNVLAIKWGYAVVKLKLS